MKKIPLFSVVIPLYNKEKYIKRTINSVLNQTCKDFEIIVVDDKSTDNSLNIVKQFKDERIRIFKQKKNKGASFARNFGIKKAKAPYIAFLDADDVYIKDFLQEILRLTDKYKNIKFFATAYKKVFDNKKTELKALGSRRDFIVKSFIASVAKNKFFIHISSVVVHKSVFAKTGYFGYLSKESKKSNSFGEDFDMWLRIARRYKLCYSNHVGSLYYKNTTNNVTTDKKEGYDYKSYENTLIKMIHLFRKSNEQKIYINLLNKLYSRIIVQFIVTGQINKAKRMLNNNITNLNIKKKIEQLIKKLEATKRFEI